MPSDAPSSERSADAAALDAFVDRLRREAPQTVPDAAAETLMRQRATAALAVTRGLLAGHPAPVRTTRTSSDEADADAADEVAAEMPVIEDVGARRARAGVHPVQSLRAGHAMFCTAIGVLAAEQPPERSTEVAITLHAVITEVLAAGALPFVDVLLDRISTANIDERRRIARDLHDHTSQNISAAIHGVELAEHRVATGEPVDAEHLAGLRRTMLETLRDVRALSAQLRDTVGRRRLAEALRDHLALTAPEGLSTSVVEVDARGAEPVETAVELPARLKEEAYLVLREAVHNALVHDTDKTRLDVRLELVGADLRAEVLDDGCGFDPVTEVGGGTVGLVSMAERAQGLGGALAVEAAPGRGVRVTLQVPVPTEASA